jgi:hypothetical protein
MLAYKWLRDSSGSSLDGSGRDSVREGIDVAIEELESFGGTLTGRKEVLNGRVERGRRVGIQEAERLIEEAAQEWRAEAMGEDKKSEQQPRQRASIAALP